MIKTIVILCICITFAFCQVLSLSAREKRAMKNDFAILDNAYANGYTEHFLEFSEKFLQEYKLASIDKDVKIRQIYMSVKNARAHYSQSIVSNEQIEENAVVLEEDEMQKLFSAILLSPVEDILDFAEKHPDYRTKDILGAIERARVNDLQFILATIARNTIPVREIVRFSQIYGDEVAVMQIKTATESSVLRNIAHLPDYRRVFGITDFDSKVEQTLYTRIMNIDANHYRNLVAYVEHFPEGRYIAFVTELMANYR